MKLEMTAPVTRAAEADGYVAQFVPPKAVALATAPEPKAARISMRV